MSSKKINIDEVKLNSKEILRQNFFKFLSEKIQPFKVSKLKDKGNYLFTCPSCLKQTALFMAETNKVFCQHCNFQGSILEVAYLVDTSLKEKKFHEIAEYLYIKYGIRLTEFNAQLAKFYFDCYKKHNFDLVPLIKNQKIPFEKDWVNREHKSLEEWLKWFESGFNVGVKTGKKSNITVIDIDTKDMPEVFVNLENYIMQSTPKGYHFVFQYEPDLPTTRFEELKIDLLNDGKQFVVYPSIVDGVDRFWNFKEVCPEIPKMTKEIKDFLVSNLSSGIPPKINETEQLIRDIANDDLSGASLVEDGNRHNSLIRFGGVLRKRLTIQDTQYVLELFNKNFVKPPLNARDFLALVKSLDRYMNVDERELAIRILEYLRYAEEGTSKDIEQALGEKKSRVDKALSFLIKEQYIVKRNRMFHLLKKIVWREDFPSLHNEVDFLVPYFHDTAIFNWGDLILLGGQSGYGKTTISMNFIKRFKEQGLTPHYICLETGSRFIKTAAHLGLKEGDFRWCVQTDPSKIELEKNSITILDWLLIEDKSQTDTVMKYFVEQLVRTNGFLIIFMQLKEDNGWFAPNMVKQFPAFAARYLYDEDGNGITGSWHVDKIREAKRQMKRSTIPCHYMWDTKLLKRIDELKPKGPEIEIIPTTNKKTETENEEVVV